MVAAPNTPPRPRASPPPPRGPSNRPPPPRRYTPDDCQFEASFTRLQDTVSSDADRRFAALAALPTPADAKICTQMWIPAVQLTADHNISDILESLESEDQPEIWKGSRSLLRDFNRIPHRGISFVCTSDTVLSRLGGVQLTICGKKVSIRKYSRFDKLYYVDLQRLPTDVSDPAIYDWFTLRGARPVLITPTQVHGMLNSRARTVYFNSVSCPTELFEPDSLPLREISFIAGEKPCFVQHRLQRHNRVRPPSLRPQPRRQSDASDATMGSSSGGQATPAPRAHAGSQSNDSAPASDTQVLQRGSTPLDPSRVSSPLDSSRIPAPLDSSRASASSDPANVSAASSRPVGTVVPSGSRADSSRVPRFILGHVDVDEPDWKLVQHSQYGIIRRDDARKFVEPENAHPCELREDESDPHALVYSIPVMPNTYEVLRDDGFDASLPPDVDLYPTMQDEDEGMSTAVSGFAADSPLLDLQEEVRAMKAVRQLPLKIEQVSIQELQQAIDEYLEQDVLNYTCHDDVLAAVQVQPAYFRRIFQLPIERQRKLFKAHAVYRAVCAEPLLEDENKDVPDRLRTRFDVDPVDTEAAFIRLFPTADLQQASLNSALSDLFLMIFAPGIYIDPVKVQALLPPTLPPKRLRYATFLLWSDLNLLCLARSDACKIFHDDPRTPSHVVEALQHLSSAMLPSKVETAPSRWIRPQL